MIRKETKYTLGLLTFLFAGIGGFFNYLDRSIGDGISLSPGDGSGGYLFYIILGVLWLALAIFVIVVDVRKKKLGKKFGIEEEVKNEKQQHSQI